MRSFCICIFAFTLLNLAACKNAGNTNPSNTTSDSAVGGTPAPPTDGTDMSKKGVDSLRHTNSTGRDSAE
ncbi:MAG: hypothetical protein JSS82_11300 [Bacteroidetes bacterium]|nr:hypothetical protein [Bacteroidota bacterium]